MLVNAKNGYIFPSLGKQKKTIKKNLKKLERLLLGYMHGHERETCKDVCGKSIFYQFRLTFLFRVKSGSCLGYLI